jgi:hypothetical protein
MATELVKPTSTATKPAVKADRLKSLKKFMGSRAKARFKYIANNDTNKARGLKHKNA